MRESDTFQMILEEGIEKGRVEEARRALLLVGTLRLGEPDAATLQRITAETGLTQLEEWLRSASRVESWADMPGLVS